MGDSPAEVRRSTWETTEDEMTIPLDLAPFGGDTEPVDGVGTSPAGYNTEGDMRKSVKAER